MKQIKNKFGILGESHGQDRKHKEEITIFKNPAENQKRNKENNFLEVLGQALRKKAKKTCRKLKQPKKTIFQNSFLSHPKFQDLGKTKKQKNQKKTIFQNSFLNHPKFQDLEKTKKQKNKKKQYFKTLSGDTPNSKTSGKLFLFFFWFSAGFCQEA